MKNITILLTFLFITASGVLVINAQSAEEVDSMDNSYSLSIPKFNVLIDSILKRSAMVNFRNQHIGVKESELKSERRDWTENFGIVADTRYGTFDNFSTNATEINSSSSSIYTQQLNYTVGLYLKIPVFDVINRKNKIKLAKLEIDEAKSMAEFQKEEIRQTVIRLYQDLILKQKLLQIRSRRLGDGRVNMQMVEKEFRNGVVPISEYVRIVGMTENLEADYTKSMSEFITAKLMLEDMAGFEFGLTQLN